jgi:hypothetical protein
MFPVAHPRGVYSSQRLPSSFHSIQCFVPTISSIALASALTDVGPPSQPSVSRIVFAGPESATVNVTIDVSETGQSQQWMGIVAKLNRAMALRTSRSLAGSSCLDTRPDVQTCRAPSNRTWPSVSTSSTYDGHLPKQEPRSSLTKLAFPPAVPADFAPDEDEVVVEQAANAQIVIAILVSMSAQRYGVQRRRASAVRCNALWAASPRCAGQDGSTASFSMEP